MTTQDINTSGITPFDLKVLVKPDKAAAQSRGGILIPETVQRGEQYAATRGTIIALGENAFGEWGASAPRPAVGDRVIFAKYAGLDIKGADEADYRLMNDEDIVAGLATAGAA